ncbi:unnamed protein product [Mucor hiemalis]
MPRSNPNIVVGSNVSVVPKFLRDAGFLNDCRFNGRVEAIHTVRQQQFARIVFDAVPDKHFNLLLTCLKFEGPRTPRVRVRQVQVSVEQPVDEGDPDLLEDAIQDPTAHRNGQEDKEEEVVVDENWEEGDITIDERIANPFSAFRMVDPILDMDGYAYASPAKYFLHFLPCDHLRHVVIPALNYHASDNVAGWVAVD